ncbi:MAG: DNA polymerase III subunit delta [Nitriliruptorales bacterium]|nr:DNA polymerase III subunit delta [Nitriliruptorales bacterium]
MPPVHLISGSDELLVHRATEALLGRLRDDEPDLDVEVVDVSELDHLPEMRTASLFGGRKCVVLRGAEQLSGSVKSEVENYLESPSEDAVLIIAATSLGRIQKISRLAGEHGDKTKVEPPADWDDRGWDRLIGEEFRLLERSADASAIAAIRSHAGNDPAVIASKVSQVVAATERGTSVSAADVEAVVEGHGRRSGFAVADAVTDRDPAAALVALRGALESGEAPLAVLGALSFRFRQLLQARAGASAKEIGTSPNNHRRLRGIATSNFGPGELAWCHDRIARTDVDLKGSELPDELVIELAVIELATPQELGLPWNPLAS